MRASPPYSQFFKYPVVAAPLIAATATSIASWSGIDVERLFLGPEIQDGQVWRLVTSTLPHGNVLHLLFNAFAFWLFGTLLQDVWGEVRSFLLFLLLAALSMGAEYAFADGGIGLSGVVYGQFGLVWVMQKYDRRFADALDERTTRMFVIWFFVCIATTYFHIMPIANVAHGAGAIFGALIGFVIANWKQARGKVAAVALILCTGALGNGVTSGRRYINMSPHRGAQEAYLAYVALEAHNNADAVKWGERAIALNKTDPGIYHNLSIAYARVGNETKADEMYEKSRSLSPRETP